MIKELIHPCESPKLNVRSLYSETTIFDVNKKPNLLPFSCSLIDQQKTKA